MTESNSPSKHTIGTIGAGNMGVAHIKALAEHPRWDLRYVCDLDESRLRAVAEHAPATILTRDYSHILRDPEIDAVSVNTLSDARPALIRAALKAGKHVLAEKPLATTPKEEESLLKDIECSDRLVTVNLFNRNAPYLHMAREFIASGEIGELAVIRIDHVTPGRRFTDPIQRLDEDRLDYAVEGHVLTFCGMHYVDVARWFAGSEVKEYSVRAARFFDSHYENHFVVHGTFENGIVFELNNSFSYSAFADQRFSQCGQQYIGSSGVVRLTHDFKTVTLQMHGRNKTVDRTMPYGGKKLDVYYDEFARALDTGDASRLPCAIDSVVARRLSLEMSERAVQGQVASFGKRGEFEE
jgi:predicted dehydrogenase